MALSAPSGRPARPAGPPASPHGNPRQRSRPVRCPEAAPSPVVRRHCGRPLVIDTGAAVPYIDARDPEMASTTDQQQRILDAATALFAERRHPTSAELAYLSPSVDTVG